MLDESHAYGLKLNLNYESLVLNTIITWRCFENACAIVFAHTGGPSGTFVGLFDIFEPCQWDLEQFESYFIVEIDVENWKRAGLNKVRQDLAEKDWQY